MASAYITGAQLGQLSALNATLLADFDVAAVAAAIPAASATADSYLAARYTLPLVSWGDDLRQCVADIAAFRLISGYGYDPQGANGDYRQRYNDAMAWLRDVARSACTPTIVDTQPASEALGTVESNTPRGW